MAYLCETKRERCEKEAGWAVTSTVDVGTATALWAAAPAPWPDGKLCQNHAALEARRLNEQRELVPAATTHTTAGPGTVAVEMSVDLAYEVVKALAAQRTACPHNACSLCTYTFSLADNILAACRKANTMNNQAKEAAGG